MLEPDQAETARILNERARAAAAPPAVRPSDERIEVVEFTLGSESYAVETRYVREVRQLKALTPLPGAPPFLVGVISLRGEILPVLDLRSYFEMPMIGLSEVNRLVVLGEVRPELALLADSVPGLRSLPATEVQAELPTLNGIRQKFLVGVTPAMLGVLDGARLLKQGGLLGQALPESTGGSHALV